MRSAARSAADRICSRSSTSRPLRGVSLMSLASDRTTVSRLLKSCATPPARRPTLSIRCACESCSRRPCSAVMSRKIRTTPTMSPPSLRIGAAESAMTCSMPSFATSSVVVASVLVSPVAITRATGSSSLPLVRASMMRNTCPRGRPREASKLHPVSLVATGFIRVTRPRRSVAMTPSPIASSVMRRSSSLRRSAADALAFARATKWAAADASAVVTTIVMPCDCQWVRPGARVSLVSSKAAMTKATASATPATLETSDSRRAGGPTGRGYSYR